MSDDGLVIPPGEKSEAEYRAKIARGEVQEITFSYHVRKADFAGMFAFAGGHWVDGKFVPDTADRW